MTAVEWLYERLERMIPRTALYNIDKEDYFQQAKEMEKEQQGYSEEDMLKFAEFVATYPDKNRNVNGEILHAKSKYDGAERTIDLLQIWIEQFKKK